jgi:hypothetical protein
MPTITIVDGVKIQMFYNDHTPAHFHAILGSNEMLVAISELDVIRGSLPAAASGVGMGGATSGRPGFELDLVPGQPGAGEDLNMPKVLDNVIIATAADPETFGLTVTWSNGETTTISFRHLVGKGVFAALAEPDVFARVRVGERGRSLEWPGEIDFCADALWFDAHPADVPWQRQHAAS